MSQQKWRVRLGAVAELDFANIIQWTTENFGVRQSRIYRDTLLRAIGELADGPEVAGSKLRDEIMPGPRTLHVARHGRRAVTSSCIAPSKAKSSTSAVSCTTRWNCSVTCQVKRTTVIDSSRERQQEMG
jgi:plasmid stabilization system protein ParE